MTRRRFLKATGAATAAVTAPTVFVRSVRAKSDTLKIGQWTHFVPAFDEWFDKKYCPEWGQACDVFRRRLAQSRRGHDRAARDERNLANAGGGGF